MRLSHLVIGLAALALATARPGFAEDAVSIYVVTYFDVAPTAAAEAAALLRQYAEAARKEAGNLSSEGFEEIGRPNRFAILESWRDKPALEAHGAAASTSGFGAKLKLLLISGTGARLLSAFSVAAPTAQPGSGTVYVLTHVDVPPPQKDQAIELQKALAAAARKGRRQSVVRCAAAERPPEPLHALRGLARPQGLRCQHYGRAHQGLPAEAEPARRRAL